MNLVPSFALALAAAAPSQPPSPLQAMDREIAAYVEAFRRRDTAAMAALYTEDVGVIEHKEAPRHGRAAIRAMWEENRKGPALWKECRIERENTRVVGDVAYETGRSTFVFERPGGETTKLVGQFLTVWKRQGDGAWKVTMEAWME